MNTLPSKHHPARRGVVLICVLVCLLVATTLVVLSATSALRSRREALAYHQRVQLEQLIGNAVRRAQLAIAEQGTRYSGESWNLGEHDIATPGFASADVKISVSAQDEKLATVRITAALWKETNENVDQSASPAHPPVQRRTIELRLPVDGTNTLPN